MLLSYIRVALRNLSRHKVYSALNIGGLSIGILCCLVIIQYVRYEQDFDRFHPSADQIYRITEYQSFPGKDRQHVAVTPGLMIPTMKKDYPEVMDGTRMMHDDSYLLKSGDQSEVFRNVVYADSNVFRFFNFPLLRGDAGTALRKPYSIVISEGVARRFFGVEDPIGQVLLESHNYPLTITGVAADVPENSHIRFDAMISWSSTTTAATAGNFGWMNNWRAQSVYSYVLLTPGTSPAALQEKFPGFLERHMPDRVTSFELALQPFLDIHLRSADLLYDFNARKGDAATVTMLSWIAGFILLMACINFMNLATARSMKRSREVGLRKVVGAHRSQLIRQFLSESVLIASLATVIAVVLSGILLPQFSQLADRTLTFDLLHDASTLLIVIGIALSAGIVAGSYPAFFLTAFRTIDVMKGSMTQTMRGVMLRRLLVVAQFAIAIVLIVGTLVIRDQLAYVRSMKLGFDKEQLAVIERPGTNSQYETIRNELLGDPAIVSVSGTSRIPGRGIPTYSGYLEVGDTDQRWDLPIIDVDYHFLDTYNIALIEGRNFDPRFPDEETRSLIINETMMRALGWTSAIGKHVRLNSPDDPPSEVIGVVGDFHIKSLHETIVPMALQYDPTQMYHLTVRVRPGASVQALDHLRSVAKTFSPDVPFGYSFLDEEFARMYQSDDQTSAIIANASLLAIVVACLGLFGLASFTAEQRTKEIGVRKVLGARIPSLLGLLTREFLLLVVMANVIGWPIAYYLSHVWLQNFAYRVAPDPLLFLLTGAVALAIALLTVGQQALRASLRNPVDALRYE